MSIDKMTELRADKQLGEIEDLIVGSSRSEREKLIAELRVKFPADTQAWCVNCQAGVQVLKNPMVDQMFCVKCQSDSVDTDIGAFMDLVHPKTN